MSPVQNIWRALVQRRLWPVAIALVAGLAAVPMLLSKDPEPAPGPPPAPAAVTADDELAAQPIVAPASAEATTKRKRVLGTRKNPFAVEKAKPQKKTTDKASDAVVTRTHTGGDDRKDTGGSGSDTPSSGDATTPSAPAAPSPPVAPVAPAEPEPKPKEYAFQELTVRFGAGDEGATRRSVKRREALPSAEQPVLIYLGVLKDGKTAEFLVDHGVTPVGDGECRPTPEQCETIRLRAGETQFFDITDETGNVVAQYQLDLVKIHRAGASGARAGRRTASASARRLRAALGATSARLP
jgi:hypothetical protein